MRARHVGGIGLLVGGVAFFVGGGLHPKEDPPGASLKEHLHAMFLDPLWYPAHSLLLLGMIALSVGLLAFARSLVPAGSAAFETSRSLRLTTRVAAVASSAATLGAALHLAMAVDSDRIAIGAPTPLSDLQLVIESMATPAFGVAIAALAAVGAVTRTLGHWSSAALGIVGGIAFGAAAGTILLTDRFDGLFPLAGGIGLWAVLAGVDLLWPLPALARAGANGTPARQGTAPA